MLTEKECRQALEILKAQVNYENVDAIICFKELIDEHFDNPPLTLDELYEFVKQDTDYHYLPVWDNKFGGQWFVLENINGNKLKFKGYDHPIEFEEGRYYRKEVQECN
jgi:hypothetical protein